MLFRYHSDIETLTKRARNLSFRDDIMTVNGCVNPLELRWHVNYVQPVGAKYIVLLRDPADLFWSAFNFWHDNNLDRTQLPPGSWTDRTSDYRSPELFHELLLSEGKLLGSDIHANTDIYRYIELATKGVVEIVGRSNVLFVRSEDMKPSKYRKTQVLEKIANFTGLNLKHFAAHMDERTNCGNSIFNRGPANTCNDKDDVHREGIYEVSGNRPMLVKSRILVYQKMKEVCEQWRAEYGVEYERCLNVDEEEAMTNDAGNEVLAEERVATAAAEAEEAARTR